MTFSPTVVTSDGPVEFKLELKVKVTLNGTDIDVVKERLHDIAWMAIEMGDVIGETSVEVEGHSINVSVVEEEDIDLAATLEKIKDEFLQESRFFRTELNKMEKLNESE